MNTRDITLKYITVLLFSLIGLSSCRKELPAINRSLNTEGSNNENSTVSLTDDEKLRILTFTVPAQKVKTVIEGTTLKMIYAQNVNISLNAKGYDLSYSIRFNETFAASALSKFSYTLPALDGSHTTDWAGNDLKVLNEVTKSYSDVNGTPRANLHLVRNFTFSKTYNTTHEAITQQNQLINTTTDVIKFTSYVIFGKEYPATTFTASLIYTK